MKIVQREAENEMGRSDEEGHIIKGVIRKMESDLDHDTLNNQNNMLAERK